MELATIFHVGTGENEEDLITQKCMVKSSSNQNSRNDSHMPRSVFIRITVTEIHKTYVKLNCDTITGMS